MDSVQSSDFFILTPSLDFLSDTERESFRTKSPYKDRSMPTKTKDRSKLINSED